MSITWISIVSVVTYSGNYLRYSFRPCSYIDEQLYSIWLERLHDVAFPTLSAFGHASALVASSIPEYPRALQIIRGWICDRFYSLHYDSADIKFLTEVVQTASLSFTFDRDYATRYTRRARCIVNLRPSPLIGENGGYILHDLINFFEGKSDSESSRESSVIRGASFIKYVMQVSFMMH